MMCVCMCKIVFKNVCVCVAVCEFVCVCVWWVFFYVFVFVC